MTIEQDDLAFAEAKNAVVEAARRADLTGLISWASSVILQWASDEERNVPAMKMAEKALPWAQETREALAALDQLEEKK